MRVHAVFAATMLAAALLGATTSARAEEARASYALEPGKEDQWLLQLVGQWEVNTQTDVGPGFPPVEGIANDTVRAVGTFWIVIESTSMSPEGEPATSLMTIGYDPVTHKVVGTWIDSLYDKLWVYEGSIDEAGTTLTLDTVGPLPREPDKPRKFRDTIELKSVDRRVYTSQMQEDDGTWVRLTRMDATRKKP